MECLFSYTGLACSARKLYTASEVACTALRTYPVVFGIPYMLPKLDLVRKLHHKCQITVEKDGITGILAGKEAVVGHWHDQDRGLLQWQPGRNSRKQWHAWNV